MLPHFCGPPPLFSSSSGIMEAFTFKATTPLPVSATLLSPRGVLFASWLVCVCVCVCGMKGPRAAPVQSLVHVLKCSPRDGQYYPCPLHQQGPGAQAGAWPFVSKQRRGGGGGGGRERTGQEGEGEGTGGRKSQSVLIKCCIEDDIPPQCVSSSVWCPPPLIQAHARTICTAGLSEGVCACIRAWAHGPIWRV